MTEQTPAGWHADPFGRFERRYWDGHRWTEHVDTGGHQRLDGLVGAPVVPAPPEERPAAGWYADPAGSGVHRYWAGNEWTNHVEASRRSGVAPANPAPPPPAGRPNRRIAKQVRKAGAGADADQGGGTLFTEQVLVINQRVKMFGSRVGYAVYDQRGVQLGTMQEVRRDLSRTLSDRRKASGRTGENTTHRFRVVDMSGRVLLEMTKPQRGWLKLHGKLVVEGDDGAPIGEIVQESFGVAGHAATAAHTGITSASTLVQYRLGGLAGMAAGLALGGIQDRLSSAVEGLDKVGHARFGLVAGGRRLGSIHSEDVTEWDFNIQDPAGTEVARITKTWAGWAKEQFTQADNYVVLMHRPLEEPLRTLVVAAAVAIDVDLKQEGRQGSDASAGRRRR